MFGSAGARCVQGPPETGFLFGWREEGICIARDEIGKLRHKASSSLP